MASRTEHGVALLLILESSAVEQLAAALSVHSALSRHVRQNAFAFASRSLFSVGVPGIGQHMDRRCWLAYGLLRGFGHGQQAARVIGFLAHLLRHNQPVFGVHRSLHVISREHSLLRLHKTGFWFAVAA